MTIPKQLIGITCATLLLSIACSPISLNSSVRRDFSTWSDRLWKNIQRQQFDYSCGAAALATVGKYYFGDPLSEPVVLYVLVNQLTEEGLKDREEHGFSLLDLRLASIKLGYSAASIILRPQDIDLLEGPIIVILNDGILDHFVVLKGKDGDMVYLADSARGNIKMPFWRFLLQWKSRVALVLGKPNMGIIKEHGLTIGKHTDTKPEIDAVRQYKSRYFVGKF